MEIEAKYTICGDLAASTVAALDLAPYRLARPQRHSFRDLQLDTAGLAITGSGYGLRVRFGEHGATLTLKGPGRQHEGVHEREELEVALPESAALDHRRWPAEIAERVRDLAGAEALSPVIRTELSRHTWAVERDGLVVGELALDEGRILAGGLSDPVHELELEIRGAGERSDLQRLGSLLRDQLPLQPEPRTKLGRGVQLLRRGGTAPGDAG